jgi:hypothetical protein
MQPFQMTFDPATLGGMNMNMLGAMASIPENYSSSNNGNDNTGSPMYSSYIAESTTTTQGQGQAVGESYRSSPSEILELPAIDVSLENKGFLDYLRDQRVFTPAENDLLLRGIITLKDYNWARIAELFLPNKSAQTLMTHFHEMSSLTTRSKNVFKE